MWSILFTRDFKIAKKNFFRQFPEVWSKLCWEASLEELNIYSLPHWFIRNLPTWLADESDFPKKKFHQRIEINEDLVFFQVFFRNFRGDLATKHEKFIFGELSTFSWKAFKIFTNRKKCSWQHFWIEHKFSPLRTSVASLCPTFD